MEISGSEIPLTPRTASCHAIQTHSHIRCLLKVACGAEKAAWYLNLDSHSDRHVISSDGMPEYLVKQDRLLCSKKKAMDEWVYDVIVADH